MLDWSVWRIRNPDSVWHHAGRVARKLIESCSELTHWPDQHRQALEGAEAA